MPWLSTSASTRNDRAKKQRSLWKTTINTSGAAPFPPARYEVCTKTYPKQTHTHHTHMAHPHNSGLPCLSPPHPRCGWEDPDDNNPKRTVVAAWQLLPLGDRTMSFSLLLAIIGYPRVPQTLLVSSMTTTVLHPAGIHLGQVNKHIARHTYIHTLYDITVLCNTRQYNSSTCVDTGST